MNPITKTNGLAAPGAVTALECDFPLVEISKKAFVRPRSSAIQDMRQAVAVLASRLQAAGMRLSAGDRFVIGAAQTLIARAADDLSFDEIKVELESSLLAVEPK